MLDPRVYILGALALLSLVSVLYLVVAAVQHIARLIRARRASSKAIASEERIGYVSEPVVPVGPPPVLESDPFRESAHPPAAPPPDRLPPPVTVQPVAPPAPLPSVEAAPVATSLAAGSGSPAGAGSTGEPLSADQAERIAALLASLEQQAEAEAIAAEPAPTAEVAPVQEHAVSLLTPVELAAPGEPAAETPVEEPFSAPPAEPVAPEPPAELVAQSGTQPSLQPPAGPVPEVAVYRLVAPVELHFTDGSGRVGVRPGTRTHDEFQRLANALLGELKRAQAGAGQ